MNLRHRLVGVVAVLALVAGLALPVLPARAEEPTNPTAFSPSNSSAPAVGSRFSVPSRCSSVSRRGGRPRLCTRATVSWPR